MRIETSSNPKMSDLGEFREVRDDMTNFTAVMPAYPPANEHGFLLQPTMPPDLETFGHIGKRACDLCGSTQEGLSKVSKNRHHNYWPNNRKITKERAVYYPDAPDYSDPVNKMLRSSGFSISKPICERWHNILHRCINGHHVQRYPLAKDLPEPNVIKKALDQFDAYTCLASLVFYSRYGIVSRQAEESTRTNLKTLEGQILFPIYGYYCLDISRYPELKDAQLPLMYDVNAVVATSESMLADLDKPQPLSARTV